MSYCDVQLLVFLFFFKRKTAYEMRISDWSSDVCSSDLSIGTQRRCLSILATMGLIEKQRRCVPSDPPADRPKARNAQTDRKSVVSGKRVSDRVELGGRRSIKETIQNIQTRFQQTTPTIILQSTSHIQRTDYLTTL